MNSNDTAPFTADVHELFAALKPEEQARAVAGANAWYAAVVARPPRQMLFGRWMKVAIARARSEATRKPGADLAALFEAHLTDQWGETLRAIYRAGEDAVRRAHPITVSHWGGRAAMLDEVVNRIYLVLCTTGQPYDPDRVSSGRVPSEEAWLGGIAAKVVLKMRDEERPHADVSELDPIDPHVLVVDDAKELAEKMLTTLPDEIDRKLFDLLYVLELSPSEAAAELNMDRDAIYKRDQRLIQKLRDAGFDPSFSTGGTRPGGKNA